MNKYSFDIRWSEEDGEFVATCPSFPGLSAFGESEEEALKEGKIALELFVESFLARNKPLPKPVVRQQYSGQLRLRLPKTLHAQAAAFADADATSLNQFIVNAIQARVSAEDSKPAANTRPSKLVRNRN